MREGINNLNRQGKNCQLGNLCTVGNMFQREAI